MFPQGAYQVLAFISTVIGSYEIHTRTMGLLKGPAWSIFAVYATFLGGFMSILRSPVYLMHSNVSPR